MPELLLELSVLTAELKDDSTSLSLQSFSYLFVTKQNGLNGNDTTLATINRLKQNQTSEDTTSGFEKH